MTSALFTLANALAAGGPVIAVGVPPETAPPGVSAVDPSRLAALAAAAADGAEAFAAATGIDATRLAGATAVLLPSRAADWHVQDAAALAVALRGFLPRVIVAALPASAVQTAAQLRRLLEEAGAAPTLAGLLPAADPLAPGSPVAVLGDAPEAAPVRTLALVTCGQPGSPPRGLVEDLAAQGVETLLIDIGTGLEPDAIPGAAIEPAAPDDLAAAVQRIGEERAPDWIVMFDAAQRPESPWPGLALPAALGRIAALGFDHAAATFVDHVHASGGVRGEWRFPSDPASLGRVVAWRRERPAAGAARRSPYNLLLHRHVAVAEPGSWRPEATWHEAAAHGAHLVERLTGQGVFTLSNLEPRGLRWAVEERIVSWSGNVLKAGIGRLPHPDPLAPRAGVSLIRWDTLDGARGSLFGGPEGEPERLLGAGPRGTVALEGMAVNAWWVVRLYDGDTRARLLGEMRLRFHWDPED